PRITPAEELVDTITSIWIGPQVERGEATVKICVSPNVPAGELPADKIKELVWLESSAGDGRAATQLNTARIAPARTQEVEQPFGPGRRSEHAKEQQARVRQRFRPRGKWSKSPSSHRFVEDKRQQSNHVGTDVGR